MATVENRSKGSRARFYDPLPARNWLLSVAALMGSFVRLVAARLFAPARGYCAGSFGTRNPLSDVLARLHAHDEVEKPNRFPSPVAFGI